MITFLRQTGAKKLEKEKDRRREEQLIACISLTECCMHLQGNRSTLHLGKNSNLLPLESGRERERSKAMNRRVSEGGEKRVGVPERVGATNLTRVKWSRRSGAWSS